jgi:hypothetical protein
VLLALAGCNAILGYTANYELADASAEGGDEGTTTDGAGNPASDGAAEGTDGTARDALPPDAPPPVEAAVPDSADEEAGEAAASDADAADGAGVPCGTAICTVGFGCCADPNGKPIGCTTPADCMPGGIFSTCDGPEDCPGGSLCCASHPPTGGGGYVTRCRAGDCNPGVHVCHLGDAMCPCRLPPTGCLQVPTCGSMCI